MNKNIVAVYGNQSGNFLVFRESEDTGILELVRDLDSTELINSIYDFIHDKDTLSFNPTVNQIMKSNKGPFTKIYVTKELLESEYIHFNLVQNQFDPEIHKEVNACGVFVLYRVDSNILANKQLLKLGIFKDIKNFIKYVLDGKSDDGLAESIILRLEIQENW